MKRTILIGLIILAMLLGTVAYASAADVNASASVSAVFSMTMNDDSTVDFGTVDPGTTTNKNADETITIKSNKLWDYSAEAIAGTWDGQAASDFLSVTTDSSRDGDITGGVTGHSRGVSVLTCDYELDLTSDAAWELSAGDYTAVITYTAVQQ